MIRIGRSPAPTGLATVQTTEAQRVANALAAGVPLSGKLVGDQYRGWARDLRTMQHGKCCYCEREIPKDYNDVEHYRPKASVKQSRTAQPSDGYWWLAWTWSNLLFSCPSCNRTAKNDLFPLRVPTTRLQPQAAPPGAEKPLLIDPSDASVDPEAHFEYRFTQLRRGHVTGKTAQGRATVKVCALHRDDLVEARGVVLDGLDGDLHQIAAHLKAGELPVAQAVWKACLTREVRRTLQFAGLRRARLEAFWNGLSASDQAALPAPPLRVC